MAEHTDELESLCDRIRTMDSPANWDQSSTLVFREIKQNLAVPVSPQYQTVDITVNTEALQSISRSDVHTECEVFVLCWGGDPDVSQFLSTMTMKTRKQVIPRTVFSNLSKGNFKQVRQLATLMFQEYKTRILRIKSPLCFVCEHRDMNAFECVKNNIKVVERKFQNIFFDDISFELHIYSGLLPEKEQVDQPRSLTGLGDNSDGILLTDKLTIQGVDTMNMVELERLERQVRLQAEHIEKTYREQKRRNSEMRSTLRSVIKMDSGVPANAIVTPKRVAGDGAEIETLQQEPETELIIPTGSTRSDIKTSKLNKNRDEISPKETSHTSSSDRIVATSAEQLGTKQDDVTIASQSRDKQRTESNSSKLGNSDLRSKAAVTLLETDDSGHRGNGMDTFMCFHCTDRVDMDRSVLHEMKETAIEYIQNLEEIYSEHNVEENIAIVAKDQNSWTMHQPTNKYSLVKKKIDNLCLEFTTGFLETFQVTLDFIQKSGKNFRLDSEYNIGPRLVIFTNHTTFSSSDGFPVPYPVDEEEFKEIKEAFDNSYELTREVAAMIVVGDADREFLRKLERVTNVLCYERSDVARVSKYQLTKVAAGRMIMYLKYQGKSMSGNISADSKTLMECFGAHLDGESKQLVEDGIVKYMKLKGHGQGATSRPQQNLPPLGSRVVRGEDWMWENQDTEGPGTVIEHLSGDAVAVEWDNGHKAKYRYGENGAYDVKVVHDQPKENTSNSSIDVGCEVVRGPDWKPGNDEDGGEGSVGVVINSGLFGLLRVRWYGNGSINTYRFGNDGKLDVMLRDPADARGESTSSLNTPQAQKQEEASNQEGVLKRKEESKQEKVLKQEEATRQENVSNQAESSRQKTVPKQAETSTLETVSELEFVWQWQDDGSSWQSYPDESCQKLEASFTRRPTGSCLVHRNNKSYRILFKEMEEKCLQDNTRRKVQRKSAPSS